MSIPSIPRAHIAETNKGNECDMNDPCQIFEVGLLLLPPLLLSNIHSAPRGNELTAAAATIVVTPSTYSGNAQSEKWSCTRWSMLVARTVTNSLTSAKHWKFPGAFHAKLWRLIYRLNFRQMMSLANSQIRVFLHWPTAIWFWKPWII